ncbi:hypothetical protein BJX99DRAFT_256118 [Aspergillus californicus]
MASLRKACRNCTSSKRKCVVQLPKCTRCAQRGLECTYDLEPLNAPVTRPKNSLQLSFNPSVCDTPGYCLIKTVKARSDVDPAICEPGYPDAFEVLRLGYDDVSGLVKAGRPATFVHPKLQLHSHCNHFAALLGPGGVSYQGFKRLLQLEPRTMSTEEALTALQALCIYLARFYFEEERLTGGLLGVLHDWTGALLASAEANMPRDRSPWQAWLFGESIRRTIIMSCALSMTFTSFNYGYCTGWLFLESLPFDRRAGLWMAVSPQAWIATAGVRAGEEVGERLVSYHEFAESLDRSNSDFHGDTFLSLLAFAHNGAKEDTSGN